MNTKVRKLMKRIIKLEYDYPGNEAFLDMLLKEEMKAYEARDEKSKEEFRRQMRQNFDILSKNKV